MLVAYYVDREPTELLGERSSRAGAALLHTCSTRKVPKLLREGLGVQELLGYPSL